MQDDLKKLDIEHEELKKELEDRFEKEKQNKLAEYQDKLRNAKGKNDFQNVLLDYQTAQLQVESQL